ncbi:hypothetical protein P8452_32462 [Trifolium repens]|nr:hypothetical protein P8452_32462 [Trifolium repens]
MLSDSLIQGTNCSLKYFEIRQLLRCLLLRGSLERKISRYFGRVQKEENGTREQRFRFTPPPPTPTTYPSLFEAPTGTANTTIRDLEVEEVQVHANEGGVT